MLKPLPATYQTYLAAASKNCSYSFCICRIQSGHFPFSFSSLSLGGTCRKYSRVNRTPWGTISILFLKSSLNFLNLLRASFSSVLYPFGGLIIPFCMGRKWSSLMDKSRAVTNVSQLMEDFKIYSINTKLIKMRSQSNCVEFFLFGPLWFLVLLVVVLVS